MQTGIFKLPEVIKDIVETSTFVEAGTEDLTDDIKSVEPLLILEETPDGDLVVVSEEQEVSVEDLLTAIDDLEGSVESFAGDTEVTSSFGGPNPIFAPIKNSALPGLFVQGKSIEAFLIGDDSETYDQIAAFLYLLDSEHEVTINVNTGSTPMYDTLDLVDAIYKFQGKVTLHVDGIYDIYGLLLVQAADVVHVSSPVVVISPNRNVGFGGIANAKLNVEYTEKYLKTVGEDLVTSGLLTADQVVDINDNNKVVTIPASQLIKV